MRWGGPSPPNLCAPGETHPLRISTPRGEARPSLPDRCRRVRGPPSTAHRRVVPVPEPAVVDEPPVPPLHPVQPVVHVVAVLPVPLLLPVPVQRPFLSLLYSGLRRARLPVWDTGPRSTRGAFVIEVGDTTRRAPSTLRRSLVSDRRPPTRTSPCDVSGPTTEPAPESKGWTLYP